MQPAARPSDPAPGAKRLLHPGWVCLVLALLTLAIYWPVHGHDFVNYDDSDYVTANSHVLAGLKWETLTWALTSGQASNWHPLTWLSHALDCQIFGARPGPAHLMSVGFHLLNTLLVFLLLRRLTGAHWRSAVVAAFFALHPLHVESVAWVSERKDVLSALFFLLTLGAYGQYATRRSGICYGLGLVFFALGLMSKPMLVTVPFVLFLLDWWPLGRWQLSAPAKEPASRPTAQPAGPTGPGTSTTAARNRGNKGPRKRGPSEREDSLAAMGSDGAPTARREGPAGWRLVAEKLPFFGLAAASSVVTFTVQRKGGAVSTVLSLDARLANAAISYVRYIAKTFWPVNLSVLYPHPGHWPGWQVLGSSLALLAVFGAVTAVARGRPYVATGWLWFCGMLVPVIGLVQVGVQSMADRYMYLPILGLLIPVVWGLAELVVTRPGGRPLLGGVALLALAACGATTAHQIQYWKESEALFTRAVTVTEKNYLAYNNLGYYLSNHGRPEEGMRFYQKSLEINPRYEDALNNLGYALAGRRKFAEALPYYEAALRAHPNHVEVNNNYGNALSELGRIDEAIKHYQVTLSQNPDHADANSNLGIALAMKGRVDEALPLFRRALRTKPTDAGIHSNLGNALAVQHKLDEAIKEYQESLRLRPNDPQAHNNLANVLLQKGQVDAAIAQYLQALHLNPNNPEAHANLGSVLFTQGKLDEAGRHYQAALTLNPNSASAHGGLGDTLLRLGHRDEAIAHYREALRLDPSFTPVKRQLEALVPGP